MGNKYENEKYDHEYIALYIIYLETIGLSFITWIKEACLLHDVK